MKIIRCFVYNKMYRTQPTNRPRWLYSVMNETKTEKKKFRARKALIFAVAKQQ